MSTIDLQKNPEFAKEPQWDMFRGNNHVRIVGHDTHHGGHVNLGNYVGRKLSDYLWNDLINRMWVNSIGIFGPGDGQWLIGHGLGHCKITLDKNDNISSISFTPTINYPQPYTEDELMDAMDCALNGDTEKLKSLYDMLEKRRNTPFVFFENVAGGILCGCDNCHKEEE